MAKNTKETVEETVAVSDRTEPMNVSPDQSIGLLAAWDGINLILGGEVEGWEVTDEGIYALGFTLPADFDPEVILESVNRKERRVSLFPAINWLNGATPAPFTTPQEVQAYLTQYFSGSTGDGSSRVAKNIRDAAKAYRKATMGVSRPGPKPQILKKLASLDASQLKEASVDDLDHFEELIRQARASQATAEIVTA